MRAPQARRAAALAVAIGLLAGCDAGGDDPVVGDGAPSGSDAAAAGEGEASAEDPGAAGEGESPGDGTDGAGDGDAGDASEAPGDREPDPDDVAAGGEESENGSVPADDAGSGDAEAQGGTRDSDDGSDDDGNGSAADEGDGADPESAGPPTGRQICQRVPGADVGAALRAEIISTRPKDDATPQCAYVFENDEGTPTNATVSVLRPEEDLDGRRGREAFAYVLEANRQQAVEPPRETDVAVGDEAVLLTGGQLHFAVVRYGERIATTLLRTADGDAPAAAALTRATAPLAP